MQTCSPNWRQPSWFHKISSKHRNNNIIRRFHDFFLQSFCRANTQQQQRPGSLNTWKQTEDFKNSWTYSWLAAARQTDQQQHYEQKCQNIAHKLWRLFSSYLKLVSLGWLHVYYGRLGVIVVDLCSFALFEDFSI